MKVEGKYGRPATYAGYFTEQRIEEACTEALKLDGKAKGIYLTLNPVDSALLARRYHRVGRADSGEQTSDKDIERRRLILIDADPVRPSGISSTDAEKQSALATLLKLRDWLRSLEFSPAAIGDSGNGYHLLQLVRPAERRAVSSTRHAVFGGAGPAVLDEPSEDRYLGRQREPDDEGLRHARL